MEILLGLAGLAGLALLLQSKPAVPSEADFKKAQAKLETEPFDPDANTVVGKYLAFVLGDFKASAPYLLRSGDATLRLLMEHETTPPYTESAVQKIGMGDEWVAAAKNYKPLYRTFYDRASQWYGQAYPDVEGIWKDKLRERLVRLLQSPVVGGGLKKGMPAGWNSTQASDKIFMDSTVAHGGTRSARIDMARDNPNAPFWFQSPQIPAPKGEVVYSAWVATDGTNSPNDKIHLNFYNQAGGLISFLEAKLTPDSPWWKRYEIKAEIPKNAARFVVAIYFNSTSGTVWVDDFSLKSAGKELVENGSFEK